MDSSVKLAIESAGGVSALARQLGIAHTSVLDWERVPLRHLFTIEALTGIPREQLRPDIFLQPRPRKRVNGAPPKPLGLRAAIEAVGSLRSLARELGISPQALSQWKRVPAYRILQIEAVTGIPRERLRPDLFRREGEAVS